MAALIGMSTSAGVLEAQMPDSTSASMTVQSDAIQYQTTLPEAVVTHLGHITTAFFDTPSGMGILPVGMAEAAIAKEYAWLAGQDSADILNMTENMSHVLHAIDPVEVGAGFGLGYGFKRAAEGVIAHIELAETSDGVSETVLFHAPFVNRAARGSLVRADEAIAMARRIQRATDPVETLPLIEELRDLIRAMAFGTDRDRDGRIGQTEPEAGLAQAWYHLQLLYRVEGLEMPPLVADTLVMDAPGMAIETTGVRR